MIQFGGFARDVLHVFVLLFFVFLVVSSVFSPIVSPVSGLSLVSVPSARFRARGPGGIFYMMMYNHIICVQCSACMWSALSCLALLLKLLATR